MAIGQFNQDRNSLPTAEINMTPLVDVMLVLLIIFIITTPLMTHSASVDLPRAASTPTSEKPLTLEVSVTADDQVFIGTETVDLLALDARFRAAVAKDPKVEMHLKADGATRYEIVAETPECRPTRWAWPHRICYPAESPLAITQQN